MSFVMVDRLHVRYGGVLAVRGVSFAIPRGEIFGFIGPNGAGKSSTIRVLATLVRPSSGRAAVGGVDVVEDPLAVRRLIGYVPDEFGTYDDMSVREYLHFFAAIHAIPVARRTRLVADVLALTDLGAKQNEPVAGLSRGMKQRLAISRVLLHDPELLLLDEPASGLDPRSRIEMRELLKELQRLGKTIIISSHILHELAQLCSHIGIIDQGRMRAAGHIDGIFRQLELLRVVHIQLAPGGTVTPAAIAALPGVAGVDEQADRLAVRLPADDGAVDALFAGLVGLGARLRMFQPEALDMETAFMKLTGAEAR
ncbi:MAG: ABC transporter ATP-binding protein [Planctomycetes bacterium]|nr:ABC transporter ATP-binding protein [Planctomycetota bacterium]